MAGKARTRLLVGAMAALCALAAAPLIPAASAVAPAAGTVAPAFTLTQGDLRVAVTGLPAGVRATVKVYKGAVLKATLLPTVGTPAVKRILAPGTYTVRTTALTSTQGRLVPTTTSRTVTVVKNKAVTTTLAFRWGLGVARVLRVGGTAVGWTFVSTAARLSLTITNRSKSLPLKGLTLVVPKGVTGLTAPVLTVPSKPAGSWRKSVVACAASAACSYRVTLAPRVPTNATTHLRYGQSVAVTLAFTTPGSVGARTVVVQPIGAFAVDGSQPSFRVVKGETVPATPEIPIPEADTTVTVPGSGTSLVAGLPNGAYGPVSVYYEPTPCSLGLTGSCITATVDGTFSKDGVHLYGWGDVESEQPLPPASLTITCDVEDCPEVGTVTTMAAGTKHTCAIRVPGTVWCFGNNGDGQLGISANVGDQNFVQANPVQVPGITDAVAVATGHTHTCVTRTGGSVWCWGANGFGQTGIPNSTLPDSTPRQVPGVTGATAVSAGSKHTCAAGTGGAVWCWGNNRYGQLGTALNNGGDVDTAPQQVPGITDAFAVAAGGEHTCVAITGGSLKCFGRNDVGQLGAEGGYLQLTANPAPQSVTTVQGATSVSAGYNTTCVATTALQALCFGDGSSGELGFTSSFTNAADSVKTDIDGTTPLGLVRSIAPGNGENDFFCAVLTIGEQWCWGSNGFYQFGFVANGGDRAVQNIYVSSAKAAATGMMHTCVVRTTLAPQCMGNNRWGQLASTVSTGTDNGVAFPLTITAFDVDRRLLDFEAFRLKVSMKQPNGTFTPFGTAGPCSDIADPVPTSPGMQMTDQIMLPAARTAGYCMDVWAFSRDPDTRALKRVVLYAEDPRFTPISR